MKICIVAQGGGMTTSYHAGVIKAIKEKFGFNKVGRIVASSGAATTYSYLVSGQDNLIEKIWLELVKSKKFVIPLKHPSGRGIMDIDFLVDEIIKRKFPLDLDGLKKSLIDLDVGLTNAKTGESVFFSKNDDIDFYELLRASCAIPYFYGKKVCLGADCYYDGTISSVCGIEKAKDEDNILVVFTRPNKPLMKIILFRKILKWLLIRKETKELQEAIWSMVANYEKIPSIINDLSGKEKNVVIIQPQRKLPIWRIDMSLHRLQKTIKQGYDDVMNNKEIDKLFL